MIFLKAVAFLRNKWKEMDSGHLFRVVTGCLQDPCSMLEMGTLTAKILEINKNANICGSGNAQIQGICGRSYVLLPHVKNIV